MCVCICVCACVTPRESPEPDAVERSSPQLLNPRDLLVQEKHQVEVKHLLFVAFLSLHFRYCSVYYGFNSILFSISGTGHFIVGFTVFYIVSPVGVSSLWLLLYVI